ncbi:hypothetical protein DEJ15_09190 [Curtobacterium sp. MCJR17_043]|nr:hypothetical protein [Curtobacterium sp. MCJR17_043]WIB34768.1 hypothetical protein DEJ15_09190 [Curtobacterium sp. MCJR17_043]
MIATTRTGACTVCPNACIVSVAVVPAVTSGVPSGAVRSTRADPMEAGAIGTPCSSNVTGLYRTSSSSGASSTRTPMPLRSWICHVSACITAVSKRWSPCPMRARDSAGVKPSGG